MLSVAGRGLRRPRELGREGSQVQKYRTFSFAVLIRSKLEGEVSYTFLSFLSLHPILSEEFTLVYKVLWEWESAQRDQGQEQGMSEEKKKRGAQEGLRQNLDSNEGTENNEPLLRARPHSQVLTQEGPEGNQAAPPTGLPTDAGDSEFRFG